MSRDEESVLDMVVAARLATQFVEGMDRESFMKDAKTQAAVMREFEIIGEAAKRVSEPYRSAHPQIDWRGAAGLRDLLIHQYQRVNLQRLWQAVETELPGLLKELEAIAPREDT